MISCVGGTLAGVLLENIKNSKKFDYHLIGADAAQDTPPAIKLLDRFYRTPMGDDPDYVERILEIVKKEKIDIFMPGSDGEAAAVAAKRGEFIKAGAHPLVSSHETLEIIADKADVYACMEKNGIPVPEYRVCETGDDVFAALSEFGYPERSVIVKPARGRGGRGLRVFCGKDSPPPWLGQGAREERMEEESIVPEYLDSLKKDRYLVMPCLSLPAYDVDVLAENGQTRGLVVRERVNPTGIPFEGNIIRADESIGDYCRAVVRAMNLDSLHDLDLMSENETPRLLEINPRPSGSMAASLGAGFPLVDAAIARFYGEAICLPIVGGNIEVMPSADGLTVRPLGMGTD